MVWDPTVRDPGTRELLPVRQVGFLTQVWLKRTQSDSCLPSQLPNKTFQTLLTKLKLSLFFFLNNFRAVTKRPSPWPPASEPSNGAAAPESWTPDSCPASPASARFPVGSRTLPLAVPGVPGALVPAPLELLVLQGCGSPLCLPPCPRPAARLRPAAGKSGH